MLDPKKQILWNVRIRMPREMLDVQMITTKKATGDGDEQEVRRVADAYIQTLASPSIVFVRALRAIVATSEQFPDPHAKATAEDETPKGSDGRPLTGAAAAAAKRKAAGPQGEPAESGAESDAGNGPDPA